MDPNNAPNNKDAEELTVDLPSAPTASDEAGEDIGEAPRPEQTIDLEKELGENIHLPGSPSAAKGPSLADALASVRSQGKGAPFMAAQPLREIPHVPSEAPQPPKQPAVPPSTKETPPPVVSQTPALTIAAPVSVPQPKLTETPVVPRISVMHPEVVSSTPPTPVKPQPTTPAPQTPQAPVPTQPPAPHPRSVEAAQATSFLASLEKAAASPAAASVAGVTKEATAVKVPAENPAAPKSATSIPVPAPVKPATPVVSHIAGAPKSHVSVIEQLRELVTSPLHPLRTYKTDAEESVKTNRTSLVTMAAAEEERRTHTIATDYKEEPTRSTFSWTKTILWVLSILLIFSGCVAAFYIYVGPPPVDTPANVQASNILYVDNSVELPLGSLDHTAIMRALSDLRDKTALSLGLMEEIYFTVETAPTNNSEQAGKRLATTQEVLSRVAPRMPPALLRALSPEFIMGTHVYGNNQGYIVVKSDSYQQAFSGMLEWEPSMLSDLLPFLDRRPRPKLPDEKTNATTTPRIIASSFVDRVVRNHDARVLYNDAGDMVLLYSFINQHTIAITTNENTLFEIASRLRDARF